MCNIVQQWTTVYNNGQQWTTMCNNVQQWTKMDNNGQHSAMKIVNQTFLELPLFALQAVPLQVTLKNWQLVRMLLLLLLLLMY